MDPAGNGQCPPRPGGLGDAGLSVGRSAGNESQACERDGAVRGCRGHRTGRAAGDVGVCVPTLRCPDAPGTWTVLVAGQPQRQISSQKVTLMRKRQGPNASPPQHDAGVEHATCGLAQTPNPFTLPSHALPPKLLQPRWALGRRDALTRAGVLVTAGQRAVHPARSLGARAVSTSPTSLRKAHRPSAAALLERGPPRRVPAGQLPPPHARSLSLSALLPVAISPPTHAGDTFCVSSVPSPLLSRSIIFPQMLGLYCVFSCVIFHHTHVSASPYPLMGTEVEFQSQLS